MDGRRAGAIALTVLSYVLRLTGIALCAMVIVLCFSGAAAQLNIVGLVVDISRAIPEAIAGYGVIASPFGGVFRLDFALLAAACYALDYLCGRLAGILRR